MEYRVVRGSSDEFVVASGKSFELNNFTKFIVEVNQLIMEGWTPLGGVAVNDNKEIFQAMTKKTNRFKQCEPAVLVWASGWTPI